MVLTPLANASWNSSCSLTKQNLNVFCVSQLAILICSKLTKSGRCPCLRPSVYHFGLNDVFIQCLIHWDLLLYRVLETAKYGSLSKKWNDQLFVVA